MKPTLLDTDTLTYFMKGHPLVVARAISYIEQNKELNINLLTQYEAMHGLLYKDARAQLPRLEELLSRYRVLPLTNESVRLSATIYADLKRQGQPLMHTDVLIAGIAMANGMQLATNNTKHFERVEGLQLVNWTL
ncbi:type II toxin-antitoxin system VapC family toxin [uncultured Hymenobacter sp.]|uniref:type II toxin-antitoxin system VapC family toxin n=1 Tax=uncultured Hymenobacter sp. TaxID=170016 RepID=UPI0035CC711F